MIEGTVPAIIRNPTRADKVIAFIQCLPIIDGPAIGQPIKVDPWLESWLRDIYEPVYDDGTRAVRTAILSVARKNMKSLAVSGLVLCHLIGPEAVPNGQIYSCANDNGQARVIFDMIAKMIRMEPFLSGYLTIRESTSIIRVHRSDTKARGSKYKALSAEAATKHGLGANFFVYDEFGEAKANDTLYDTMIDGQQAVASPLAVIISTQNDDPQHPLSLMIDDGLRGDDPTLVCHLHAADEDCRLDDPEQWLKANPCLATWKDPRGIASKAAEAIRLPFKERNFRRRYLNQRVALTDTLITRAEWKACQAEYTIKPKTSVALSLDLSAQTDLTALVLTTMDGAKTQIASWYWKPKSLVMEHTNRDRVRYDIYAQDGTLELSTGKVIRPRDIVAKIIELMGIYDVRVLVYDRWGMKWLLPIFDDLEIPTYQGEEHSGDGLWLYPWGQGSKDMTPAINALEAAVLDKTIEHDNHPLMNFCIANAQAEDDGKGNRTFDKEASRFRIDGAVALAMGLGFKSLHRKKTAPINPFEDPNFSILDL